MIELTYFNSKTVNLADIQKIAEEIGLPVFHMPLPPPWDALQIQIEQDKGIYCLWEVIEGNNLEIFKEAYENFHTHIVNLDKAVSIHGVSFPAEITPHVKNLLHNIFLKYGGWLIDAETPSYDPSTRGQVRKYTLANIDEFLKPPGEKRNHLRHG